MANIIDRGRPEVIELQPVEHEGIGRPEDSRLKYRKVTHPTLPLERTYCTYCGRPYGWTSMEGSEMVSATEVIVICESCESDMSKIGPIPFVVAGDKNATKFERMCEAEGCRKPESDAIHHSELGLIGSHRFTPFPHLAGTLQFPKGQ